LESESKMTDEIKKTEECIRGAQELREKFQKDPQRPAYHFTPPWAWMNDVNGPLFWKGRYHIFYQHKPNGAYRKLVESEPARMRWGHASSADLVHWTHHPIALTPTPGGPDSGGCNSGGVVVNNGVATFIYWGDPGGLCLATSDDPELIRWTKHPANPVMPNPEPDAPYRVHDPCAWKHGDLWYTLCGSRDPDGRDVAYLFKSQDLIHWEYLHPFYDSNPRWIEDGEDCAVPDFFPLGDKHMLLFCSHLTGTQYYLGRYEDDRFYLEQHARMSWPGGLLGGGFTMLDEKGRRIFLDWIREARTPEAERASGWSGVMTLPRILSLAEDGSLAIEPVPEVEVLRLNHRRHENIRLTADSELTLDDVRGDRLELAVEVDAGDLPEFGVKVRCSPGGEEQTAIVLNPGAKTLSVEMGESSLDESIQYLYYRWAKESPDGKLTIDAQSAPFALADGESLKLRIFLDRSVLEVFANGRQCVTQRIYPTRSDSLGVVLFSRGGSVNVKSVDAWDMAATAE